MSVEQRGHKSLLIAVLVFLLSVTLAVSTASAREFADEDTAQTIEPVAAYIVQGQDVARVAEAVAAVGGTITHELGIINAVGAQLTPAQHAQLSQNPEITYIFENGTVDTSSTGSVSIRDNSRGTAHHRNDGSPAPGGVTSASNGWVPQE